MKYKFVTSDLTTIYFNELTLRGYKEIVKASYGDEVSMSSLFDTIVSVLSEHSDKSIEFFESLNICDLMDILIEVRSNSMGNTSSILVPAEEDKQIKVDLKLDWIQEDIRELILFCREQTITIENLKLTYGCPSLLKLMTNVSEDEQFLSFLEKAEITNDGKYASLTIKTIDDGRRVLNSLNAREGNVVVDLFYKIAKFINSQDTLSRYKIKTKEKLRFVPNSTSFVWFVKLMYNDSLDSIYNNIFMLSKHANMTPEYIEQCTPGEYMFFVKKLEEDFKESQDEPNDNVDLT